MSERITIEVQRRQGTGKSVARKLRREGKIPGVIYGPGIDPVYITTDPIAVVHLIETGKAENVLIDVRTEDGNQWTCLVKDYQIHPVRHEILHVDFYAVPFDEKISVRVPIELVGEAPGVKAGGILEFFIRELEVECLAQNIPESIQVDISGLGINDVIMVKDLHLPEEVKAVEDPESVVVGVFAAAEEEEAEEGVFEEEVEPEVIKKGKTEEPEEE